MRIGASCVQLLVLSVLGTVQLPAAPPVTFLPPQNYDVSAPEPKSILAADFNRDRDLDLIVTSYGMDDEPGNVTLLLGDGMGHFTDDHVFAQGHRPWGVAAGDVNNDGRADVAIGEGGHDNHNVLVYLGNGAGDFALKTILSAGAFVVGVAVGDYNRDGRADIAAAANVSGGLKIFLGHGDGFFDPALTVADSIYLMATGIAQGFFNADAHLDLAVSHYNGCAIFSGDGTGNFALAGGAGSNLLTEAVAVGPLGGNAAPDLATVEIYSGLLRVCVNDGAGGFTTVDSPAAGGFPRGLAIGMVNLDLNSDIVVACEDNHAIAFFGRNADGTLDPRQFLPVGSQPRGVAVGDWNGDGWPDLATACRNLGDTAYVSILLQQPTIAGPPAVTLKINGENPPSHVVPTPGPVRLTLDMLPGAPNPTLDWYFALIYQSKLYWVTPQGLSLSASPLLSSPAFILENLGLINTTLPPGSMMTFAFVLADGATIVGADYISAIIE